jgi:tetratricopeptide (TPR) repeat protein
MLKNHKPKDRSSILFLVGRIVLPLGLALLIELSPLPARLADAAHQAQTAASQGQPTVEASRLAEVAGVYSWRADLWEQLGMSALQAGQFETAVRGLSQARNLGGLSQAGWLALGDAYAQMGQYPLAIETWNARQQAAGASVEVFQRIEAAYRALGDNEGRRRVLQAWADWQPADAKVVYRLGLWLAASQPEAGLAVLLRAAQLDPSLYSQARVLQTGINTAFGVDDPAYRLVQAGRAMISLGEWEAAAEAFGQAVKANPGFADAWAFLSEAQQHFGLDGLPALQQALALNPDSLLVQAVQALSWQQQGELDRAVTAVQAIAAHEPQNGIWQVSLGGLMAQKGDLMAALDHYQKAVQLEPNNPVFWRALANFSVIYEVKVSEVGLPAARQAVSLAGEDPANLDVLGQALAAVEDLATAERLFQRALQQDPQFAPAFLHLGLVYLTQGQDARGLELLKEAARLAPGDPVGEQAQRIMERYIP